MNSALAAWNSADEASAFEAMLACCGSKRWAAAMVALRPIGTVEQLRESADRIWDMMGEPDWLEAFSCHPRIGERKVETPGQSAAWSRQEQSRASAAGEDVLDELALGNKAYLQRFGFTYIVCASGKSAEEMLAILKNRLAGTRESELRQAAEQQRQIMQIRLGKWLVQ